MKSYIQLSEVLNINTVFNIIYFKTINFIKQ
jgi:hypothetical protein